MRHNIYDMNQEPEAFGELAGIVRAQQHKRTPGIHTPVKPSRDFWDVGEPDQPVEVSTRTLFPDEHPSGSGRRIDNEAEAGIPREADSRTFG